MELETEEDIIKRINLHLAQVELLNQKLKERKQDTSVSPQNEEQNQKLQDQLDPIPTFNKRRGVTDDTIEFSYPLLAFYALRLIVNKQVQDFEMTANNKEDGLFDDIGLTVRFVDGSSRKFLFKFKHEEGDEFTLEDLTLKGENSMCSLKDDVKRISAMNFGEDTIHILSTNAATEMRGKLSLTEDIVLEQCDHIEFEDFLLNTYKGHENIIFEVKCESLKHKLYLLTAQMEEPVDWSKAILRSLLQSNNIHGALVCYMRHWWAGRFALTKHDVIAKIAQLALSPFLKTLTDEKCNEKSENLKRAIMDFPLTIVENCDEEIVENIWKIEESWMDEDFRKTRSKYRLREVEKNTALWYLGKLPLVVRVDGSNEKLIKRVMNLLGKSTRNKKIVLTGQVSRNDFEMGDTLGSLLDVVKKCAKKEYYSDILQNFRVSLQGRRRVKLEHFVTYYEELVKCIGTTELLKMSQHKHFLVGNQIDELPCYILRSISPLLVKIEDILHACRSCSDTLVIVNGEEKCPKKLFSNVVRFQGTLEQYIHYLRSEDGSTVVMLPKKSKCSSFQFETICKKSRKSNVYLLQQFDEDNCTVILQKGKKLKFEYRDTTKVVKENDLLEYYSNPVNVLCGPPGTGKSTLMESLNNNCSSRSLAVRVDLINYNSFLADEPDFETILARFLRIDGTEDVLFDQFKKQFWQKRKLYMFLHGLDEVSVKCVKHVLNFVKHMASQGGNIWISSRENLREEICRMFHVVPLDIKELDEDEQRRYIYNRLERKYEDDQMEKITTAIFNNKVLNNYRKLVGIPLQLHMITEMFSHNMLLYNKLQNENYFRLVTMFELFFEGKIQFVLNKLVDEKQEHRFGDINHVLQAYQLLAVKTCLNSEEYNKLPINQKLVEDFSETIKREGDPFGIIKTISKDGRTIFHHQTYAQYLAYTFLKKDPNRITSLRDQIFDKRYGNFRKFLDVIWSEGTPLHLALLSEDLNRVDQLVGGPEPEVAEMFETRRINSTDGVGRTVFHLAFSYGYRYPPFLDSNYLSSGDWKTQQRKTPEILQRLLKVSPIPDKRDILFDLECSSYALKSKCLYYLETLLESSLMTFDELKESLEDIDQGTLACCCAQFGYPTILHWLIKQNPSVLDEQEDLLQLALLGCDGDECSPPRKGNVQCAKLLLEEGARLNCTEEFILSEISKRNCSDTLSVLVDYNMSNSPEFPKFDQVDLSYYKMYCAEVVRWIQEFEHKVGVRNHLGETLLHKATKFRNYEILKVLLSKESSDVNAQDNNGITALHLACQQGLLNTEMFLMRGANINLADNGKNNALHHASMSVFSNRHIIPDLINKGLSVDERNEQGQTPLHLACESSNFDNLRILLEHGANPALTDNGKNNALHYVARQKRKSGEMIYISIDENMMITNLQTLFPYKEGPNHGNLEKCLEKLASLRMADDGGSNALHYVATSKFGNREIIEMLIGKGLSVDEQNEQGQTPLHLACERCNVDNVKELLEQGANPKLGDNRKNNALHYSSRQPQANCFTIEILVDESLMSVDEQNQDGQTPLHLACKEGDHRNVQMLLMKLANFKVEDNEGNNALHYASMSRDPETLKFLINKELDISKKNSKGQTPLHLAARDGCLGNVKFLLKHTKDIHVTDNNGNNALHYAAMSECDKDIIDLLITEGFNVDTENKEGFAAIHFGTREGNLKTVEHLLQHGAKQCAECQNIESSHCIIA